MLENPDVILFLKQYREKSVDFSLYPFCDSEAVCVIPKRFERLTHALEGRCSIQLSYGTDL